MGDKKRAIRKGTSGDPGPLPVGKLPYANKDDQPADKPVKPVQMPYSTANSDDKATGGSGLQGAVGDNEHTPATPTDFTADTDTSLQGGAGPAPAFAGEVIDDPTDTEDLTTTSHDGEVTIRLTDDDYIDNNHDTDDDDNDDDETYEPGSGKYVRRSGTDSADREEYRDVPSRRDLIVFTDEPGQKKFSERRKRTRLNKGGMFFNERDRLIVLLVAAHGWLDINQLSQLTGSSTGALRHPLKRLTEHGLLDNRFVGFIGQTLYTVTAFGLRKTGADGFNTGVIPRLTTVEHTDAITALHIYMREQFPDSIFMTERELYAAVASGKLSPRILAAQPWADGYSDFDKWVPHTVTDKGKPVTKRPDGYLLVKRGDKLMPPQAVEIERNVKTRKGYYVDAALMFANAAKDKNISPIVTYFAPAYDGTEQALRDELDAIYDPAKSKFNWPPHLPKVKFEVRNLDDFYTPYTVIRGWIPARQIDTDTD